MHREPIVAPGVTIAPLPAVNPRPSVGRTVHYVSPSTGECRAAVVTGLCDNPDGVDPETGTACVYLFVMAPKGLSLRPHTPQAEGERRGGTWHWPERVEA